MGAGREWTLDLTANTDFAQVEADVAQINLPDSAFSPEKRDFSWRNAGIFESGAAASADRHPCSCSSVGGSVLVGRRGAAPRRGAADRPRGPVSPVRGPGVVTAEDAGQPRTNGAWRACGGTSAAAPSGSDHHAPRARRGRDRRLRGSRFFVAAHQRLEISAYAAGKRSPPAGQRTVREPARV